MTKSVREIKGMPIHALDGEVGHVEEFYFDDETWAVRYLIVSTGNWLSGRLVLISPAFLRAADSDLHSLHVALSRQQIENSPDIDTQRPVSRHHEIGYLNYYGASAYWGGAGLWGAGGLPSDIIGMTLPLEIESTAQAEAADSHLRSTNAVTGYHVEATDGEIGHIDDFILDQPTWSIRSLKIATRDWLPGKKVLISPRSVLKIDWLTSEITVSLSRQAIQDAPDYTEAA